MGDAIGVRFDDETLDKIDTLSKEESLDRSTIVRKLVQEGYRTHMAQKVLMRYAQGSITLSEAARSSDMTIWEIRDYFVSHGLRSEYGVEDLKNDLLVIEKKKRK
jgi:predicted HTH domain antitoxin